MKKSFLLMSVLASLFMAGCSQEDFVPNSEGENKNSEVQTSYLSINLMSADDTGTRAASGYQDGEPEENKITKVRFYFFTESGAPSNVKMQAGSYVNYYDWTPNDDDQIQDTNTDDAVESKLKQATLVINTAEGDKLPRQIVALLNPTENLPIGSRTLSELRNLTNDYAKSALTTSGKFVMFNSVYADAGHEICAVPIESENLCSKAADAIANPVNIYVERNVAKVEMAIGDEMVFSDNMLPLKDTDGNPLLVEGEQVYLKVNGWRLTAETNCGRLSKDFDLGWLDGAKSTWVNLPNRHRSCWAVNAPNARNVYYNYNEISGNLGKALYTNENAEDVTTDGSTVGLNRTKVIISGTLYKKTENGAATPFTIVRHLGAHFADVADATDESKNLAALKRNMIRQLMTNGYHYYYETTENDETVRKSIAPEDLQVMITSQQEQEDSKNNCYVYVQLTTTAQTKKWYNSLDDDAIPLSADEVKAINTNFADTKVVDRALVWNSGMTYYYYSVVHHGNPTAANATEGVVRNHWYKTKVTKIAGLGTPVYDPTQKIYPEKPDPKEYYIAAQINILSWHIVNNNYELVW